MALIVEEATPFSRTEIPESIIMRFRRPDGTTPVDLTDESWSAFVEITQPNGTSADKAAEITDGQDGKVRYSFEDGDLDNEGTVSIQFRVESGADPPTTRLYSSVVELAVFQTPKDEGSS